MFGSLEIGLAGNKLNNPSGAMVAKMSQLIRSFSDNEWLLVEQMAISLMPAAALMGSRPWLE